MTSDNGTGSSREPRSSIAELGGPEGVANLVRSLVSVMRDGGVTKLDLSVGAFSLSLRGGANSAYSSGVEATGDGVIDLGTPRPASEHVITAPMIGTFYASPSPGAPPFVEIGDAIKPGQVVGIIEAMKIMNEIVADAAGEVAAILATNGQPVEYGSPLILLTMGSDS